MSDAGGATPLLEQYAGVKARYPGHLVLFRVGDFYETFGDDARLLSRELDVVLTARSADRLGDRTPMAGVPHHAVEAYLARLVRKGYKIALCDQVEDPRAAKGLLRREVTRVVTPGTVVEEGILGGPDHNFLAAACLSLGRGSYAVVDVTTGEWFHGLSEGEGLQGLVGSIAPFFPRELLVVAAPPGSASPELEPALRREFPLARLEPAPLPLSEAELPQGVRTEGSAVDERVSLADRALAAYVRTAQPRLLPHLELVDRGTAPRRLALDAKTLRHLEISRPMNPDDPGGTTLLDAWDETVTSPGRRTLGFWLANPLADIDAITGRQEAVQALVRRGAALAGIRTALAPIPDLARIASRLAGRRIRPIEVGSLRDGLLRAARLPEEVGTPDDPALLQRIGRELRPPVALVERLVSALPDRPPATEADGGLFRPGHAPEIDAWIESEQAALRELGSLERSEQESTGIRTLKIRYNQLFGYYVEVTRPHLSKIPAHYRRRQTVSQAERYTFERLEEIEHRILEARDRARTGEAALWERFLTSLDDFVPAIHRVARSLGALDALASFAYVAERRKCVRPSVDASSSLVIRDGRHPVLDGLLGERFVPNDTELDAESARLLILTGPNMSGKSTYMRQIGLIVVLAQAGAFVPAKFARIGLVTGLFTRMGFTDEIGRGKSSFMVEMTEVAAILRRADGRSLVLLDEVGRGTSTFDGLAIAWATIRHLHDVTRCRAVLATHYHQLTQLVPSLGAALQAHLAVHERAEGIVFLHRLVPGSTDRSYGIHVARIAGLPKDVLAEADRLLRRLEGEGISLSASSQEPSSAPRYAQAVLLATEGAPPAASPLLEELRALEPERLTPVEALQKLIELRRRAVSGAPGGER